MDRRLERLIRRGLRTAGQQFEEARRAYRDGRGEDPGGPAADLPVDDDGNPRIVCRRHAERRAVPVDADGRPACFEAGHPDCEGCAEDVREGRIETW